MLRKFLFCIVLLPLNFVYSQDNDSIFQQNNEDTIKEVETIESAKEEILNNEESFDIDAPTFLATMDSTLVDFYRDLEHMETDRDLLNVFDYELKEVPEPSDAEFKKRLADLNEMTPFDFEWNDATEATIKMFAKKRRRFASVTMARGALYFPLYEENLDKYGMPLELKYLSVIESGLRPTAKSRAGALGLWQFMYRTGKMMGLEVNSYVDMRMDPKMATDAACRYLTYLYKMYDDWSMALAAYNAGPGNVNKAIRRSGGKMTYWEIRPYLPKETQNYVPIFIAMTYIMTYHAEHNIFPANVEWNHYEVDTICPKQSIKLSFLDSLLDMPLANIQYLNPIFKSDIVPYTDDQNYCLTLPIDKVSLFIELEDSIYTQFNKAVEEDSIVIIQEKTFHYVRSGENLGVIAQRYKVSVRDLISWNNLRNTNIFPKQKLVVKKQVEKVIKREPKKEEKMETSSLIDGKYYQIEKGDSLWVVSNKFGTTVDALTSLNPNVNASNLQTGQKIRVK